MFKLRIGERILVPLIELGESNRDYSYDGHDCQQQVGVMTALKAGHNCDFYREVAVMTRPCVGQICDLLLGRRYAQVAVMPADLRCITATSRRSHGRRYDGYRGDVRW